jgi:hypothetical protein
MDQSNLYGPQPDGSFHFRRMNIPNALYQDIMALGGKLETPERNVPYFKIPTKTDTQRAAVAELVRRWEVNFESTFPEVVKGEKVQYVQPALRRLGGQALIGPTGERVGYVFRAPDQSGVDGSDPDDVAELAAAIDNHQKRFALAKHITGMEPNPSLAAELGVQMMTDRNAMLVRDELKKKYGTYYDRDVKALIFVPDATLKPETAREAYAAAEILVKTARVKNPMEFDRLTVGLQIIIDKGLSAQVFKGEIVNSMDDLLALDLGGVDYRDAYREGKRAYRELIESDKDQAVEVDGQRAYSLDAAVNMLMGKSQDTLGLDSVINTAREANRDPSRSVSGAAYAASEDVRAFAEQFASDAHAIDGRVTDAEDLAQQIQRIVDEFDIKELEVFSVAKNTATYGPPIAQHGELIAQLVNTENGDQEIVVHDRREMIFQIIKDKNKEFESASIGHLLSNEVIEKAIADKTPMAIVAHGGVSFALSATKLGLTHLAGAPQSEIEQAFGAAAAEEMKHVSAAHYGLIRSNADALRGPKGLPVPAPYALPENPTDVDRAKAELHNADRDAMINANADRQKNYNDIVSEARTRFGKPDMPARRAESAGGFYGEIVGVTRDGAGFLFNQLVPKKDGNGALVIENRNIVLESPEKPKLIIVDARDHVVPLRDKYPQVFMAGWNRAAAELTVGVSQGKLVINQLTGANIQKLADMGHAYWLDKVSQPAPVHEMPIARIHPKFGATNPNEAGQFQSDRELATLKLETDTRIAVATQAGLDIHKKLSELRENNPTATIKDAAVMLGITVIRAERVDVPRLKKSAIDTLVDSEPDVVMGDEANPAWKEIQKKINTITERTGEGIEYSDVFGAGKGFTALTAKELVITGTLAGYDPDVPVMFVHQANPNGSPHDRHRIYRVDDAPRALPVYDAKRANGSTPILPYKVGDTIRISYDPISPTFVSPKLEIVNKELSREIAVANKVEEKANNLKDEAQRKADDLVVDRQTLDELYYNVSEKVLATTDHARRADLRVIPVDERAKNTGFLYADTYKGGEFVVQVAHSGPGGADLKGVRVFMDPDLYARVRAEDARKRTKQGMYAEIVIDGNRRPMIVDSRTVEEFREEEFQVEIDREQAEAERLLTDYAKATGREDELAEVIEEDRAVAQESKRKRKQA